MKFFIAVLETEDAASICAHITKYEHQKRKKVNVFYLLSLINFYK